MSPALGNALDTLGAGPAPAHHPLAAWIRHALPSPWAALANGALSLVLVIATALAATIFLVWLERKACARFQARLGPTRVGPFGLLQPVADSIKLLFKEGTRPGSSDPVLYHLGPMLPITAAFLALLAIPFDADLQAVGLPHGVIYVAALSGFSLLGILLGGWAANSKYSLLGAMRSGAQLFSYELSLLLSLLLVVLAAGTTSLQGVVQSQGGHLWDWWIFRLPVAGAVAFLAFIASTTAELGRGPLDLSEAESELTGGFHTEYGSMAFAMYYLAEFVHMLVAACLAATFFLGGYLAPRFGLHGLDAALALVPGFAWLGLKAGLVVFLYMWLRWSLPRLRIDHLLAFEWKFLLPVAMANLLLAAGLVGLGWTLP